MLIQMYIKIFIQTIILYSCYKFCFFFSKIRLRKLSPKWNLEIKLIKIWIHTWTELQCLTFSVLQWGLQKKCYALLTVAAATKKHSTPKNKTTTNLKPKPVFLRRKLNMLALNIKLAQKSSTYCNLRNNSFTFCHGFLKILKMVCFS